MSEDQHNNGPERQGEPGNGERREVQPQLKPRIWVGSLADYNNGILHGEWLDAWGEPDEIGVGVARILEASPTPGAEEWSIFDYDDFAGLRISEHESLETVSRLAQGVREHGPAFAAWADICDNDPEALADFEHAFVGECRSLTDYADEMRRLLPDWLLDYVRLDAAAFGRDLDASGQIYIAHAPGGGIWIFDGTYVP